MARCWLPLLSLWYWPPVLVALAYSSGYLHDEESLIHHSIALHKQASAFPWDHGKVDSLSRERDDWLRSNATCEAILRGVIQVDRELTDREFEEYGEKGLCMRPHRLSKFAKTVQKVPKGFVDRLDALDHTKRRQFNFIGSMEYIHPGKKETRKWIFPFAKRHFHSEDILRVTDAEKRGNYRPVGDFDVSLHPKNFTDQLDNPFFDTSYFQTLASSNFTLCPGGDSGWSVRIWEAAAAGSICVVRSLELDVNANKALCRVPFRFYSVNSSFHFRQDVADHNRRAFLKYQTFMNGDKEPLEPQDGDCSGRIVG